MGMARQPANAVPPPITLGLAPGELDALTCYTRLSFATLTRDGKVDRSDVQLIFNARGHQAPVPGDPRDADEDSVITVNDARICVLQSTKPELCPIGRIRRKGKG